MNFLEKYASGMALPKFSFSMESIQSLACFWSCEDVLWHRHPEYQIASIVFQ